jgi:hypothetical protein|tara:strand:+ start:807 stop:1850 length:1044 start_codon:yes stop_codon:yes gene_type:complete
MLGTYYYHEIIRKTIIGFGTLFNDIFIKHENIDNTTLDETKVGLAYGPQQKFFAKIREQANLTKAVAITLPRMSFEMTSIQYDATRKSGITQTFKASDGTNLKKVFMPVPYNIGFELSIFSKLNDDALQIIEQILPYFQPSFNITVNLVSSIGEKRDVPIVLDNISFRDEYEGDFTTRTALIYTLQFTAKTYLFGPVSDTSDGLIKKVQVDYASDTAASARRQMRYVATPKALKDYNNDQTTTITEDLTTTETRISVTASASLSVNDRIVIDSEIMKISQIVDATTIIVKRGFDSSIPAQHTSASTINLLTTADDAAIVPGDDFGFNEFESFFDDGKSYSPTKQSDI